MYVCTRCPPFKYPPRYLQSALEVHFNAPTLKADLHETPSWQYIYNNGITSLFQAYTWSLDIFVDFAW
jgi:hypothetical protein